MSGQINRRAFLEMAALGGVVFASGLTREARAAGTDFFFVQLSDTHWGYNDPNVNPEAASSLHRAIAAVNKLKPAPDFVIFTGDLTQNTDDAGERRKRMGEFREIAKEIKVKDVKFIPGEHDATADKGAAYQEFFGPMHYAFDHKGIHFIVIDNVSNAALGIGDAQLEWLAGDLKGRDPKSPIVVFTHRPLFDLFPAWDWSTRDGAKAIDLLMPFANVTVFYGHIHQLHEHATGHITHYAAQSLMWPLPAPGSVPKKAPIAWDAAHPFKDLGFREVTARRAKGEVKLALKPDPLV